eukprot:GEMP01023100.1.p1 GENE.GEMP01023100.1~~GEMP01023100.1.p1  ORF type:complete len:587 (+),score=131.40 GEMP01023100.1:182-1942(+)
MDIAFRRDRERQAIADASLLSSHLDRKITAARDRSAALLFDKSEGKKMRKKAIWVDAAITPQVLRRHYNQAFATEIKSHGVLPTHAKALGTLQQATRLVLATDQRLQIDEKKRMRRSFKTVQIAQKMEDTGRRETTFLQVHEARARGWNSKVPFAKLSPRRTLDSCESCRDVKSKARVSTAPSWQSLPARRPHFAERKLARVTADRDRRDELAVRLTASMVDVTARRERILGERLERVALDAERENQKVLEAALRRSYILDQYTQTIQTDTENKLLSANAMSNQRLWDVQKEVYERSHNTRLRVDARQARSRALHDFASLMRKVTDNWSQKRRGAIIADILQGRVSSTIALREKAAHRAHKVRRRLEAVSDASLVGEDSRPDVHSAFGSARPAGDGEVGRDEQPDSDDNDRPVKEKKPNALESKVGSRADPRLWSCREPTRKNYKALVAEVEQSCERLLALAEGPERAQAGDAGEGLSSGHVPLLLTAPALPVPKNIDDFLAQKQQESKDVQIPREQQTLDIAVNTIDRYLLHGEMPEPEALVQVGSMGQRQLVEFEEVVQRSIEMAKSHPQQTPEFFDETSGKSA